MFTSVDEIDDIKNGIRGWGCSIFLKSADLFEDVDFKKKYNDLYNVHILGALQTTSGYANNIIGEYETLWTRFYPANTKPLTYTLTASDSGTTLHSLIYQHAKHRANNRSITKGRAIFFDGVYGAGKGEYSAVNHIKGIRNHFAGSINPKYIINVPYTRSLNPKLDDSQQESMMKKEIKVLRKIADLIDDPSNEIGAIWIETIVGHIRNVSFLSTVFLKKLRKLADDRGVAIICDEVLTCCGRTGKPLAYQHHDDFEPDYFIFGKGMIASGIAVVSRFDAITFTADWTSISAYPQTLLASMQVLKYLIKNDICSNVERNGKIILENILQHDKNATGIGMMINTSLETNTSRGVGFRLLLALDLNLYQIKNFILDFNKDRYHFSNCGSCSQSDPDQFCMRCPTSYHRRCIIEKVCLHNVRKYLLTIYTSR